MVYRNIYNPDIYLCQRGFVVRFVITFAEKSQYAKLAAADFFQVVRHARSTFVRQDERHVDPEFSGLDASLMLVGFDDI